MGAREFAFLPATTTTSSTCGFSISMAPERKVPLPHGSRALSEPMREDSPAARMTPAKLGERAMKPNDSRKTRMLRHRYPGWKKRRGHSAPQHDPFRE